MGKVAVYKFLIANPATGENNFSRKYATLQAIEFHNSGQRKNIEILPDKTTVKFVEESLLDRDGYYTPPKK